MFYFGSFPLFVLLVILFLYLRSRIKGLERRLDQYEKQGMSHATGTTTEKAPLNTVTPAASVLPASVTSAPWTPKPVTESQKVSNEELSGRWLGKIGIVAIVLGVSFFLKWAFENNIIGPAGRVALGVVGGLILIGVGQWLRKKYLVYSDILMGGGIAILYLTIFAAFQFYHLITSQTLAFGLMLLVTVLSAVLSILGGTQNLAVLGVLGGFLTPFLLSTGTNNLAGLMSYVLLIDVGVLAVALFKRWSTLNYLGFIGTAIIFSAWFDRFYTKEQLFLTALFLTCFFGVYLVTALIHTVIWKRVSSNLDLALTTLNAGGYAFLMYGILNPTYHSVMGFFFVVLAALYFIVAFLAAKLNPTDKTLNFYMPGIAIVFISLALPVQLKGYWITLAWLVEAVVLYAVSFVVFRSSMRVFGAVVYALGVFRFFTIDLPRLYDITTYTTIFNRYFVIVFVAIIGAYAIAFFYKRALGEGANETYKKGAAIFFVVAQLLSLYILTFEITVHYAKREALYERDFWKSMEAYSQYRTGGYASCGYYGSYRYGTNRWTSRYYNEFQYPPNPSIETPRYDVNGNYIPPSQPDERTVAEISARCASREEALSGIVNLRNTWISIVWALYAVLLAAAGFVLHARLFRILGITLFFVTAVKVFIDVWSLGQVYRIISSITFGVLALVISFVYTKWKNRLKEIL